jgi:hypothetical protein
VSTADLVVGQQGALAVAAAEIAHDRVRFPDDAALVVDRRDAAVRVEGQVFAGVEAAEGAADVVAPVR